MRINSTLVKSLRHSAGLTQLKLSSLAKLSLRTIKTVENGNPEVSPTTRQKLANVFRIAPIQLLVDFVEEPNNQGFPLFLLQQVFPIKINHDLMETVKQGILADMQADYKSAEAWLKKVYNTQPEDDYDMKAQFLVKYAASLDNAGNSQKTVELLEPIVMGRTKRKVKSQVKNWVTYHLAVAYRRVSEDFNDGSEEILDEAERLFRIVQTTGEPHQMIAATHQLGVILWIRAQIEGSTKLYKSAKKHFETAQKRWKKNNNFREGYSLRRLADIARAENNDERALELLFDALEVFAKHECERYVSEVRGKLMTFYNEQKAQTRATEV